LPAVPLLRLGALDGPAAQAMLSAGAGHQVPESVFLALRRAAGGNPLVLRALVGTLAPDELAGRTPLPDPLPVGGEIAGLYRLELEAMPASTRSALLVLAVSEQAAPELLLPAVAALAGDPAALDPAERSGLVRSGPSGLVFAHPMLRWVIQQDGTTAERRAAHRALAGTLPDGEVELRAWHRALAALGPDEEAAAELARTAALAGRRGGRWAECRAYELAARLSPDPELRAQRAYRAGTAAFMAGRHALAQEHLDAVLAVTADPLLRADAEHERARVSLWRGRPVPPERMTAAADGVAVYDGERAAKLVAYATVNLGAECRSAEALPYALRAWDLVGRRSLPLVVTFKVAYTLVMTGETADGERLASAAAEHADDGDDVTALAMLGPVLAWLDRMADADRVLGRAVELGRAGGDLWMLVNALTNAAEVSRRRGRLDRALVQADEARALSGQLDEPVQLATALAVLARVQADLGGHAEAEAHANRVQRTSEPPPATELRVTCAAALGALALAAGRYQDAVDRLGPVVDLLVAGGVAEPRVFGVQTDLAEAYARCARPADAERLVDALDGYARPRKAASVLAAVARCRGMVAAEDEFEPFFGESAELFQSVDAPLERARTLLCLGERLRRAGRRSRARDQVRSALAIFEERGAAVWADRARHELLATGETVLRRTDDPRRQLTPQELQIALLVADGARNQDVAMSLFLSPKTVEAHLTRVYRKLGVGSRTQLAARLVRVPAEGVP
jgi:DNA-binding CsgD family transcriptional regulator